MTPQSHFTVVAPIASGREPELRALLETMNSEPGIADPSNALMPFGEIKGLHFARLLILEDATLVDYAVYDLPQPNFPKQLVFMGDGDGDSRELLTDVARCGGSGLRRIFALCEGFDSPVDLLEWMVAHDLPVAAGYVNWIGRTVRQVREESALQRALSARVPRDSITDVAAAKRIRHDLVEFVRAEIGAGRLVLTPPNPTPLQWQVRNLAHAVAIPLIGLLALPLIIVLLPYVLILLRYREVTDPEIYPRPDSQALQTLRQLEDRDVTNQFSALGSVKPGMFRRWLVTVLLVLIDYSCRHVFNRGHLGRVQTIHFARWVFVDDKARMIFASNYDGSHEAYMDDFINKVAWGLNLVFSNGIGWPRTDWLIKRGARYEQRFKYYQRRHQIPTQVWYKAYPGLTLIDLERNHRIREGVERTEMTHSEILAWLKLL